MTSLIDTIEDAVREAALDRSGDVVQCAPVVEAIEVYVKTSEDTHGTLESIVDCAYLDARHIYGNDWYAYHGHIAELVCDGLRRYAAVAS